MRPLLAAAACAAALAASPARAQLSNHSISVESGLSAPLRGGGAGRAAFAVAATAWLDGDVEVVARVSRASAPAAAGRGADASLAGTLGLRLSLGEAPLRAQLQADLGWARVGGGAASADRLAFGVGAGLEAFVARDLSVSARAALRLTGPAQAGEAVLAVSAYF